MNLFNPRPSTLAVSIAASLTHAPAVWKQTSYKVTHEPSGLELHGLDRPRDIHLVTREGSKYRMLYWVDRRIIHRAYRAWLASSIMNLVLQ